MLWIYILDKCNHAGIYKHSNRLENCCLGCKVNWVEALGLFENRIEHIGANKYFIPKFIEFQYGKLSNECRPHKPVLEKLREEGLLQRVLKGYTKGIERGIKQRKDKGKEKRKDKEQVKEKYLDYVYLTSKEHKALVERFGEEGAKTWIKTLDDGIAIKGYKYESHYRAILKWSENESGGKNGKIKSKYDGLEREI